MNNKLMGTLPLMAYAAPGVPLAMLLMQIIVYVPPMYAAETGLTIAQVGLIFFLARGLDAFFDVLVGAWSDKTRSRFGRRKPWIAIGVPCLVVTTWLFCQPPQGVGLLWLAVTATLFYVSLTVVMIPYLSWGAELSRDYTQRTRITAFREGGLMVGTVLAMVLPLIVLRDPNPSLKEITGVFAIAILLLLPPLTAWALKSTPQGEFVDTGRKSLLESLRGVRRNGLLVRLLSGVFFIWLGGAIFNALILFIVQQYLQLPNSAFLWLVFIQFLVGVLCLPIWVKVSHRIGRHKALVIGSMSFLLMLPGFFLLPQGGFVEALVFQAFLGLFTSVIWVMPPALVSDAIEYGMMKGSGDDAAIYMSLFYFAQKMALAVGVGIGLPLAGAFGFDPGASNSPEAIEGLMLVALVLPMLFALPGALLLFNYPLNRKRHDILRRWLARRAARSVA